MSKEGTHNTEIIDVEKIIRSPLLDNSAEVELGRFQFGTEGEHSQIFPPLSSQDGDGESEEAVRETSFSKVTPNA